MDGKTWIGRTRGLVLAAMAGVVAMLFAMSVGAGAARADVFVDSYDLATAKGEKTVAYYPGDNSYGLNYYLISAKSKKSPKKVKSSNKKVLSVTAGNENGYALILLECKKPGTATVSYKFKGKTHKVKFNVVKYKCPLKTLKVGKKNYTSAFKKSAYGETGGKALSGKVKVKLKDGWKVAKIQALRMDTGKMKTLKANKKLPANCGAIYVTAKNTETKQKIRFTLSTW